MATPSNLITAVFMGRSPYFVPQYSSMLMLLEPKYVDLGQLCSRIPIASKENEKGMRRRAASSSI